jgi:hypothetical protein
MTDGKKQAPERVEIMVQTRSGPPLAMDDEVPASPVQEALSSSEKQDAKDQAAMTAMLRRAAGKTSADAVKMQIRAEEHRQHANWMEARGDRVGPMLERDKARELDLEAEWILEPCLHTTGQVAVGNGGEIAIGTKAMAPFVDTVRENPNMLTIDASRRRMELADKANALELGLDAVATIQPRNSMEKMMVHQMAAAHVAAMELQAEARELMQRYKRTGYVHQHLSIEAGRLTNASARMMGAYQDGLLTLTKIRSGGQQTVVVQHVNVGSGGQAVVAGQVKAKTKRRPRGEGQ